MRWCVLFLVFLIMLPRPVAAGVSQGCCSSLGACACCDEGVDCGCQGERLPSGQSVAVMSKICTLRLGMFTDAYIVQGDFLYLFDLNRRLLRPPNGQA